MELTKKRTHNLPLKQVLRDIYLISINSTTCALRKRGKHPIIYGYVLERNIQLRIMCLYVVLQNYFPPSAATSLHCFRK